MSEMQAHRLHTPGIVAFNGRYATEIDTTIFWQELGERLALVFVQALLIILLRYSYPFFPSTLVKRPLSGDELL